MPETYKTQITEAVHEAASDLHEISLLEKKTMKRFDECGLTPVKKLSPEEIHAIREKEHAS